MTIERSLRRRAIQARCLSVLWLSLAILILVGTYISLPFIGNKTLTYISQVNDSFVEPHSIGFPSTLETRAFSQAQILSLGILVLAMIAIVYTCFLLGRAAFIEIGIAVRYSGLADALCIAGDDFDRLQKLAELFAPKDFSFPRMLASKDRESLVELLKLMRRG